MKRRRTTWQGLVVCTVLMMEGTSPGATADKLSKPRAAAPFYADPLFDAAHDAASIRVDIEQTIRYFYPDYMIFDDYSAEADVKKVVDEYIEKDYFRVMTYLISSFQTPFHRFDFLTGDKIRFKCPEI